MSENSDMGSLSLTDPKPITLFVDNHFNFEKLNFSFNVTSIIYQLFVK